MMLRWLPALAATAYVATVAALGSALVENNNWDTDASGTFTLAERLRGSGPVWVAHYGEWTTFWGLLGTRALPWHEQLWTASGYLLTLAGAALLGWATARVGGRWAGVTAGAAALVVGPFVLRSFLSIGGSHLTNPFGAVVLAAALVLLTRTSSWVPAIVSGLVAGTNAASDPLLWLAGVVPFVIAAGLLAWTTRRRDVGLRAGATLGVTVFSAIATNLVMHTLDFHVVDASTVGLDELRGLPENMLHLGRMIALLGGANYALPGPYPQEPLRAIVALLVLAAVLAPIVVAFKARRAEPMLRAYACYWALAVGLLCLVFVITPNATDLGPKSVNYLLTLAPAGAAGIALLGARSRRAQLVVAFGLAVVAAVNIAGIVGGRAEVTGVGALRKYEEPLVQLLEREGVTRGFAGFWNAQNLTWQTDLRLVVAPVSNCGAQLCPYNVFTIRSWYEPEGGPTFLLLDPTLHVIHAPPFASQAFETHRFGPLTVYLFAYDIARHIRFAPS
ncbi:MAG: hypothetical protein V7645_2321 [Actinomycetota bacterium]|jgi:hypothetical protein